MSMEKFCSWWKQDKRIMTLVQSLCLGLLPVLCCLMYCAMEGRSIGDMSCFWSYGLEPIGGLVMISDRHYIPRAYEIMVQGELYYFTVFTEVEDILEFRDRMSGNNTVVAVYDGN